VAPLRGVDVNIIVTWVGRMRLICAYTEIQLPGHSNTFGIRAAVTFELHRLPGRSEFSRDWPKRGKQLRRK